MAPEIGPSLREGRIRRGIELREVEQATKIRVRYLRAMEEDRWEVLPGTAYRRGFLSTYARFLGLDAEALLQAYDRQERVEEMEPIPEEMLPKRGVVRRSPIRPSLAVLTGLLAAAVLGVAVVIGLTGGSGNGGHGAGRAASPKHGGGSPAATSTAEPPAPQPAQASLWLRSTGTVWVCLVDDQGRRLINGETLTTGEARGPFEARAFEVTFGNGYVAMAVDDKPIDVPQAAQPLGYQITSRGVTRLDASARPTCL